MNDKSRTQLPTALESIEIYDTIDTTMEHPPPHLPGATIALTQARGRGRTGPWSSPRGGAWLTLHTPQTHPPPPQLPVAVGGCLAARLQTLLPANAPSILVKWPNDLQATGKKLAGILIEHRGNTLRIGVGVNVHNNPPQGATSLARLGYRGPLSPVIAATIEAILEALTNTGRCAAEAAARDALRGRPVTVETPTGTLQGIALGIEPGTGALLLHANGQVIRVTCCHVKRAGRQPVTPQPR